MANEKLNFGDIMWVLMIVLIIFAVLGYLIDSISLIDTALAIATILMAGFVAHQAWATYAMVQQTLKQIALTQQSIEEMRKEREFFLMREHTKKIKERVIVPLLEDIEEHVKISDNGFFRVFINDPIEREVQKEIRRIEGDNPDIPDEVLENLKKSIYIRKLQECLLSGKPRSMRLQIPHSELWITSSRPIPKTVDPVLFKDLLENHAPELREKWEVLKEITKEFEKTPNENLKKRARIVLKEIKEILMKLKHKEILEGKCEFTRNEFI